MKIEEMSITLSNSDCENRAYDMNATVKKERHADTLRVESGSVNSKSNGEWLGGFSEPTIGQLQITYGASEGRAELLVAVESFVEDAKTFAQSAMPSEN